MHRENFYHTHSIDPGTTTTKTIFQFFHNFFYPKSIICCWELAFHTRSVSHPIFQFVSRVNFFINKICQCSTLFLSYALCTTGCLCLDTVHWKIPFNFFSLFSCSVNPSTNISRTCPYGIIIISRAPLEIISLFKHKNGKMIKEKKKKICKIK